MWRSTSQVVPNWPGIQTEDKSVPRGIGNLGSRLALKLDRCRFDSTRSANGTRAMGLGFTGILPDMRSQSSYSLSRSVTQRKAFAQPPWSIRSKYSTIYRPSGFSRCRYIDSFVVEPYKSLSHPYEHLSGCQSVATPPTKLDR